MITNNLTIDELNDLREQAQATINAVGFRSRAEYDRACDLLDEIDNELYNRETTSA